MIDLLAGNEQEITDFFESLLDPDPDDDDSLPGHPVLEPGRWPSGSRLYRAPPLPTTRMSR